jgi:elongation factor P
MITASQLRAGMAIRYQDQSYKVLVADYHPGQGKMGGVNHVRLRNLTTGTLWEHSFRADLKLDELPVERHSLEFLYADADTCVFMNPDNYEQAEVPAAVIGEQTRFLEPGARLPVEFIEDRPVSVVFPDVLDVKIADTPPPLHGQPDSTWKPARLANGVEVMVPPFVKTGDSIRLNLAELKYMDRVKAAKAQ